MLMPKVYLYLTNKFRFYIMSKKTAFQKSWLAVPDYSQWLREVEKDKFSAMCLFCNTVFSLSNMGRQAVTSHMRSKKHQNVLRDKSSCSSLKSFLPKENRASLPEVSTERVTTSVECSMDSYLTPDSVRGAEILWCLNSVTEHSSFRSTGRMVPLLARMFPDSAIAKKLSLQRTKVSYFIVHGLAPYFTAELLKKLEGSEKLVVGFDESLNKVSQKQQMDVNVRFWDEETNRSSTRYLTSVFLGHSRAIDLLDGFKAALANVDMKKIIQVSMDGPNVNLKFLKELREDMIHSPNDPKILDIGTCGLHVIHCAFKAAIKETSWNVVDYLRGSFYFFKDVPSRRADFTRYTESVIFPKKFCDIRWVENKEVSSRAIEILPSIAKFVECAAKDKQKYCTSKNFTLMSECLKDKLFGAKLAFFQSLAAAIEPFLKEFQGDAPMAPFLHSSFLAISHTILDKFVEPEVLKKNFADLQKIKLDDTNLRKCKDVELGFAVKDELRKAKVKDSLLSILQFRKQCVVALKKFIVKVFERSPLHFPLAKGISFFDPAVFINEKISSKRLSLCLQIIVSNNWMSGLEADEVSSALKDLIQDPNVKASMLEYKRNETRLDDHWMSILEMSNAPKKVVQFVKFILLLSHGQAHIERGFSINVQCLIDNQSDESIIALRNVYDAIHAAGGLENINISKGMLNAVKLSHSRYVECQNEKKRNAKAKDVEKDNRKRKALQLKALQDKKQKLLFEAQKEASIIDEQMNALK